MKGPPVEILRYVYDDAMKTYFVIAKNDSSQVIIKISRITNLLTKMNTFKPIQLLVKIYPNQSQFILAREVLMQVKQEPRKLVSQKTTSQLIMVKESFSKLALQGTVLPQTNDARFLLRIQVKLPLP